MRIIINWIMKQVHQVGGGVSKIIRGNNYCITPITREGKLSNCLQFIT
jgi:hypothetical protein